MPTRKNTQKNIKDEKGRKERMKNGRELTPENELQELWELNGRVKAVIAYLKTDKFVDAEQILAMLAGGDDDGLPMQDRNKD